MSVELQQFNAHALTIAVNRYKLNPEIFFNIIQNFLSHRREEILNVQLSKYCSPYEIQLKAEILPILYQFISELDYSDNVSGYYFKHGYFYIKDQRNVKPE